VLLEVSSLHSIVYKILHCYYLLSVKAALRPYDDVITAYRCHGWTYLMGASIAGVLCELTGHIDGVAKGKGGSMVRINDHIVACQST
jgi:TPP-dependent pyruvate/acetoin dehydrogenase alpha subunit